MKIAVVHALAALTREPIPPEVLVAYGLKSLSFGPEYIIPKPLDPRLPDIVAPALSRAAVPSGVAQLQSPPPPKPTPAIKETRGYQANSKHQSCQHSQRGKRQYAPPP